MPYDIRSTSRCGSNEVGLFNDETGEFYGCHSSRESAQDQIAVIENNKMLDKTDILVTPATNTVKDLDDKGTYGGYLINFGSLEKHDLERDFFNRKTEFWLDIIGNKSAVLFGHGTDEHFQKNRLDKDGADLVVKDAGVWLETQLQRRNEYEEMVHKLAEEGKLGLSSGTASHLVEREEAGKVEGKTVHHIKQWPLGLDATLTPTPAEPRLKVQPLDETEQKSIKELKEEGDYKFGIQGKAKNTQVMGEDLDGNEKELSMSEKRSLIKADFRSQFRNNDRFDGRPRIRQIFDSYVIAKMESKRYRITYSGNVNEGYEFQERSDWTEVVKDVTYIARETAKEIDEINEELEHRNGASKSDDDGSILSDINNQLDSINESIN